LCGNRQAHTDVHAAEERDGLTDLLKVGVRGIGEGDQLVLIEPAFLPIGQHIEFDAP